MGYTALVSAHMHWDDKAKRQELEILSLVHNDDEGIAIFDDVEHAINEQVVLPKGTKDYFFMALVQSSFIPTGGFLCTEEYEVEHDIKVIEKIEDIKGL